MGSIRARPARRIETRDVKKRGCIRSLLSTPTSVDSFQSCKQDRFRRHGVYCPVNAGLHLGALLCTRETNEIKQGLAEHVALAGVGLVAESCKDQVFNRRCSVHRTVCEVVKWLTREVTVSFHTARTPLTIRKKNSE